MLPQGAVPTTGTWGAFFSGKEPAPHPGRKTPGRFDSPWTPNDTKAGGLGPRLWKPPPKDRERQRKKKQGGVLFTA